MRFFFFCKQKTAYEMRISDWSSDVCSSDLAAIGFRHVHRPFRAGLGTLFVAAQFVDIGFAALLIPGVRPTTKAIKGLFLSRARGYMARHDPNRPRHQIGRAHV